MSKTWKAIALASAMIAAAVAGQAGAVPLPSASGPATLSDSLVTRVHGGHFDCRWSPQFGWHNHTNAQFRPEPCRSGGGDGYGPPPRREFERYAPPPRREFGGGHPCHFDCRYSREFGWHNHSNAQCRPEPCQDRGWR